MKGRQNRFSLNWNLSVRNYIHTFQSFIYEFFKVSISKLAKLLLIYRNVNAYIYTNSSFKHTTLEQQQSYHKSIRMINLCLWNVITIRHKTVSCFSRQTIYIIKALWWDIFHTFFFFDWEIKSTQGLTPTKATSLVGTTNTLAGKACKAC